MRGTSRSKTIREQSWYKILQDLLTKIKESYHKVLIDLIESYKIFKYLVIRSYYKIMLLIMIIIITRSQDHLANSYDMILKDLTKSSMIFEDLTTISCYKS